MGETAKGRLKTLTDERVEPGRSPVKLQAAGCTYMVAHSPFRLPLGRAQRGFQL